MLARLPEARTTRDIDLVVDATDIEEAVRSLDELAVVDLDDYMHFRRTKPAKPINLDGEYRPGVNLRYEVFIGDDQKGTLSIDLVVGDCLYGKPEKTIPKHRLNIVGLKEYPYCIYPLEDSIADKVGAILQTYHDDKPSTRIKDLVDLVLIALGHSVDTDILAHAIARETRLRKLSPASSFNVPQDWFYKHQRTYSKLAAEAKLRDELLDLQTAASLVKSFLDPVMSGMAISRHWNPASQTWDE
jgi:hypothetical protein